MAKYANEHFMNYIPDKEVEEEVLTENQKSSNLQNFQQSSDFVKHG